MGTRRRYTDREKATYLLALEANGGNLLRTAHDTGVPIKTIQEWRDGNGVNSDVADYRNEKRPDLAAKFEALANKLVDRVEEFVDDEKTTLAMVATALGIATDKYRLLLNQPTSITSHVELSDEERSDRIASILERARTRRAG